MFAFRQSNPPDRKIPHQANVSPSSSLPSSKPTRVLNIFGHQHQQHRQPNTPFQNFDFEQLGDNSSVDMSLYTTQSKPSIQYDIVRTNSDYDLQSLAPTEFTTEKKILQYKSSDQWDDDASPHLLGELDSSVSPYDFHDVLRLGRAPEPGSPQASSKTKASTKGLGVDGEEEKFDDNQRFYMRITGPVDLDESVADTTISRPQQSNTRTHRYEEEHFIARGRPRDTKYTGPIDLDESVADTATCCSSSKSKGDIACPPQIFLGQHLASEVSPHSSFEDLLDFASCDSAANCENANPPPAIVSPAVEEENNFHQSPFVWTDSDEEDDEKMPLAEKDKQIRAQQDDELDELVKKSFSQTMDSITTSLQFPNDYSSERKSTSKGTLLLTEGELEKHMERTQSSPPAPSSSFDGYDTWKRQQDNKRLCFLKLQKKVEEAKKAKVSRSRPVSSQQKINARREHKDKSSTRIPPGIHSPHQTFGDAKSHLYQSRAILDSTRSAMDHSVDSSIPTLDTGFLKPRRKSRKTQQRNHGGSRRRWTLFSFFSRFRSKNKSNKMGCLPKRQRTKGPSRKFQNETTNTSNDKLVLPLSHFMRISSDEPSEVAEFSLAPMETMGQVSLASIAHGGETSAATNSHCLEGNDYEGSTAQLAVKHLIVERQKQSQAEIEKAAQARTDRDRIDKRNHGEIQAQRKLNLGHVNNTPTIPIRFARMEAVPVRPASSKQRRPPLHHGLEEKSRGTLYDDRALQKNMSTCSSTPSVDSSVVDSSLQSKSVSTVLGPCVICHARDRDYIALPCFHFAFCGECVEKTKQQQQPTCTVCNSANVLFSRVYTD